MSTNAKTRTRPRPAKRTTAEAPPTRKAESTRTVTIPDSDRVSEAVYAAVLINAGASTTVVATAANLNRQVVTKALAKLEAAGRVVRTPGTGSGRNATPTWTAVKVNKSGTVKLRKGQLAEQAVAFLRKHPALEFTPGEIGRKLGNRSPGAVLNALMKLVPTGEIVQSSERPVRFRVTPAISNGKRGKAPKGTTRD